MAIITAVQDELDIKVDAFSRSWMAWIFSALLVMGSIFMLANVFRTTSHIGLMTVLVPLLVLILATVNVSWRSWITIDRSQGMIKMKRGVRFQENGWPTFVATFRTEPIASYNIVSLGRRACAFSDGGQYFLYTLKFAGPMKTLIIFDDCPSQKVAFNLGEEICAFLSIDFLDESGGERLVYKPTEFGKTYIERLNIIDASIAIPVLPQRGSDMQFIFCDDYIAIEFPAKGFQNRHYFDIIFSCLVVGVVLVPNIVVFIYGAISNGQEHNESYFLIIGFVAIFIILGIMMLPFRSYFDAKTSERLEITDREIRLRSITPFFRNRSWSVPLQNVTAIRCIRWPEGLLSHVARGEEILEIEDIRGKTHSVGRGISTEELEWVRKVIEAKMRTRRRDA